MFKDYVDELVRRANAHARGLSLLAGALILLLLLSGTTNAISLDYGECVDILNETNETVTICAPAFPVINETVNLDYGGSYVNPLYELTVNAPSLNNCTVIENITILNVTNTTYINNITVMNITNITTESCHMLNTSLNLTFSQLYYDSARNLTIKAPDQNTCPTLSSYEATVGYGQTQTWNYVQSIIIHGPTENCTSANVSISRPLGYGEYFKVDQPGCFVELFGPPLVNMSCPQCPACPALPVQTCPLCPKCPDNTVTKEIQVDSCPRPNPNTNCTMAIQVEGKMYCKDSLDAWNMYQVNQSIYGMTTQLQDCQIQNKVLNDAIIYIKSNSELVNTVLIIIALLILGALAKVVWEKMNRAGGPVAERKKEIIPVQVKAEDIPENMKPKEQKPQIDKKKHSNGSKKR